MFLELHLHCIGLVFLFVCCMGDDFLNFDDTLFIDSTWKTVMSIHIID